MIKLKSLLNEGESKNPLINRLLKEIQPLVDDIVKKYKEQAEKDDKRWSEYDTHLTEISLKYDMVKALEGYSKPTDKMKQVKVQTSKKGSFEISCIIERDGVDYPFNTEVIYAGGYNIQRLHFRYLTKTKLPYTSESVETQKLKAELQKLSKGEKLKADIDRWEKRIETAKKHIEQSSKFTDKEILAKYNAGDSITGKPYNWPTWSDLVKNGAAKNYNNDESYFNKKKAESEAGNIEFWKTKNIKWKQDDIKTGEKEIKKLQTKLDNL